MAKKVINYETGSDLDEAIAADMAELDDLRQLAASSLSAVKPKKVCFNPLCAYLTSQLHVCI